MNCTKRDNTMTTSKPQRGGKREGAGRPATGERRNINFRAEKDVEEILRKQDNMSKFINECIRKSQ